MTWIIPCAFQGFVENDPYIITDLWKDNSFEQYLKGILQQQKKCVLYASG